ncbi:MFS transporter [Methylobacterium sp.]|uniref:MFS transporter n=1 Tax=Methylobacterium sp. TaxID=409 RepID=UPI000C4A43DF|nr:MFS transporter [Methylobacterium sp.]MBP29037.1 MFS transporter [Methylobacterium sp.]
MPEQNAKSQAKAWGLRFVLLFGAVNLFGDMTYEGARSVLGPFLATLGASGFLVGAVTGFGELLGYTLRFVSGRWADRSHLYWPITLLGYAVQMAAVPTLALAGHWSVAAALIVLERIGRAVRNPPRDVMLAQAGEGMGRGWAFGVNEALDQLGAFIGPLITAAVLARGGQYGLAFAILAAPALITFALVLVARVKFPDAGRISHKDSQEHRDGYPSAFWWYVAGACLVAFGFADFSLVAYHLSKAGIVPGPWIPVFYALSMAAGGLGSLVLGRIYDKVGLIVLVPITLLVTAYVPLAFLGGFWLALAGTLLWGIGLGAHESVMQAALPDLLGKDRLGSAYGLFGACFGIAWFLGSTALGALYDTSVTAAVALGVVAQLAAVGPIVVAARKR